MSRMTFVNVHEVHPRQSTNIHERSQNTLVTFQSSITSLRIIKGKEVIFVCCCFFFIQILILITKFIMF